MPLFILLNVGFWFFASASFTRIVGGLKLIRLKGLKIGFTMYSGEVGQ
jgi:hypothetical protein